MKKITSSLTPTRFRILLITLIALMSLATIVGFYFAQNALASYAKDVSFTVAAADSSESNIAQLKALEQELNRLKEVNDRAVSIVADKQSYQYQINVIDDLDKYAKVSGVSISQFSFQATSADSSTTTTTAPTPGATGATGAAGAAATPSGLQSTTVNITLNSPIGYTNLLRFLRLIEQNLTKMQISGISLSKGEDSDTVTTGSLTIEVYTR